MNNYICGDIGQILKDEVINQLKLTFPEPCFHDIVKYWYDYFPDGDEEIFVIRNGGDGCSDGMHVSVHRLFYIEIRFRNWNQVCNFLYDQIIKEYKLGILNQGLEKSILCIYMEDAYVNIVYPNLNHKFDLIRYLCDDDEIFSTFFYRKSNPVVQWMIEKMGDYSLDFLRHQYFTKCRRKEYRNGNIP